MYISVPFNENNTRKTIEECERIIACMKKLTQQRHHHTKSVQPIAERLHNFNIKLYDDE